MIQTHNAQFIEKEAAWLTRWLDERLRAHAEGGEVDTARMLHHAPPLPPAGVAYCDVIRAAELGHAERLVLMLAFLPHLRPAALDPLLIRSEALQRRFTDAFARTDAAVHIFPTTPCPAPRIDEQGKFTVAGKEASDLTLSKNTVPTSGAGLPGINIPIGLSSAGLPIGLEINSVSDNDRTLLDVARRVQAFAGVLPAPGQ